MGLFRENGSNKTDFTFLALLLLAPFYTLPGPFDPRLWRTLELAAAGTAAAVCYGPAMAPLWPLWPDYEGYDRWLQQGSWPGTAATNLATIILRIMEHGAIV